MISDKLRDALERVNVIIKQTEESLSYAGFGILEGEFGRLSWKEHRIRIGEKPFLEAKVFDRVEAIKDLNGLVVELMKKGDEIAKKLHADLDAVEDSQIFKIK